MRVKSGALRPDGPLTLGVQSENSLNRHIDAMELVSLEHDLCNLLTILVGVHGRLSQQDL